MMFEFNVKLNNSIERIISLVERDYGDVDIIEEKDDICRIRCDELNSLIDLFNEIGNNLKFFKVEKISAIYKV